MGGDADSAYECAVEMTRAWEHAEHFELYEDALPVLEELRAQGLKLGLVSNTGRDLDEFVAHHRAARRRGARLGRASGGRSRTRRSSAPCSSGSASSRRRRRWSATRSRTTSRAPAPLGIERAFLLDREDRHPEVADRLPDLFALPAALGLNRPGAV